MTMKDMLNHPFVITMVTLAVIGMIFVILMAYRQKRTLGDTKGFWRSVSVFISVGGLSGALLGWAVGSTIYGLAVGLFIGLYCKASILIAEA